MVYVCGRGVINFLGGCPPSGVGGLGNKKPSQLAGSEVDRVYLLGRSCLEDIQASM